MKIGFIGLGGIGKPMAIDSSATFAIPSSILGNSRQSDFLIFS